MANIQSNTTTSIVRKKKVFMLLPAISEPWANFLYWFGNILVVIAAGAGAIGAIAVIWGDKVRDHFNDQRISENELKTAAAIQSAADANLRAAEAEERAADANKKAAEANLLAEQERKERLKLEQRLSPRKLSPEQRSKMIELLRRYPPQSVGIANPWNSAEAAQYADQFEEVLKAAGWTIPAQRRLHAMFSEPLPTGVSIFIRDRNYIPNAASNLAGN